MTLRVRSTVRRLPSEGANSTAHPKDLQAPSSWALRNLPTPSAFFGRCKQALRSECGEPACRDGPTHPEKSFDPGRCGLAARALLLQGRNGSRWRKKELLVDDPTGSRRYRCALGFQIGHSKYACARQNQTAQRPPGNRFSRVAARSAHAVYVTLIWRMLLSFAGLDWL
jgi:hypothetical protein